MAEEKQKKQRRQAGEILKQHVGTYVRKVERMLSKVEQQFFYEMENCDLQEMKDTRTTIRKLRGHLIDWKNVSYTKNIW